MSSAKTPKCYVFTLAQFDLNVGREIEDSEVELIGSFEDVEVEGYVHHK
jgi:hypothetical protein